MAVELPFEKSLLRKLKLEDPWLPSKPWESIPSESGSSLSLSSNQKPSSSRHTPFDISSVSEESLVRLVLNALEGLQSAVVRIEQLSASLCSDPADRSGHRIQTLWNRSLSTNALGKLLKSIGFTGSLVVLLHKFVDYFTCPNLEGTITDTMEPFPHSLVNQAFAVAVRTVLQGYLCALSTLNSSVRLRRSFSNAKAMSKSSQLGSLTSISHSEVTLLEIYSHTKELRTQIDCIGHLCHLRDSALYFSLVPFEDLIAKAITEIHSFHGGGTLLTYLYRQLQVVDPAHGTLLKFLFLRSLEPYCRFIRSWIYEAKISDPYGEFIVEYPAESVPHVPGKAGAGDFRLATIREHDEAVPCFLNNVSIQLLRAGQQLQVVMKLLRLCNFVPVGEDGFDDILPSSSDFSVHKVCSYPLSFNKREVEAIALSRREVYSKMHGKLAKFMDTVHIKSRQVILHDTAYFRSSFKEGHLDVQDSSNLNETGDIFSAEDKSNFDGISQSTGSDASSMAEDFSDEMVAVEPCEYSSTDGSDEQVDAGLSHERYDSLSLPRKYYLSSLEFCTPCSEPNKMKESSWRENNAIAFRNESAPSINDVSCRESAGGSWVSEIQYAGDVPHLGWPVGSLRQNPLGIKQNFRDNKKLVSCPFITTPCTQINDEELPSSSNQSAPDSQWVDEVSKEHDLLSKSFIMQSWNAKYPTNVLSMNPILTKSAFLQDVNKHCGNTSKISKNFPYFDFSLTSNPLKLNEERFSSDQRHLNGNHDFSFADSETPAVGNVKTCRETENATDNFQLNKDQLELLDASFKQKSDTNGHLENSCGGGSWQGLLGARFSDGAKIRECEHGSEIQFDMPLDYIIDKCLQQEILLQYNYVSRLSIKLLKEGFELQEHFLALRRYHFMEIADWADLFITSLWHHKWYLMEADQKIPVIQGLLESSIQRSSCEKDHHQVRLYAYVKDHTRSPLSASAVGLHSFDYVGLGYRVDWPVSIVLTASALSIYAEIFTFLIQLKLAVLSLADVWSSLKVLSLNWHISLLHSATLNIIAPVPQGLPPESGLREGRIESNLAPVFVSDIERFFLNDPNENRVEKLQPLTATSQDFKHINSQSSGQPQVDRINFSYLVKLRHQMNHFISTLQQYILSQLSDVSWCRFCESLKHEVKDMMDLESVHMAYLMDSLRICFLSDEMGPILNNMKSILQCALDFRSCLVKGINWPANPVLVNNISGVNCSQVLSVKEKFDKHIKELHQYFLKSPKHGEFGLPRFWSRLNYNDFYSNLGSYCY